MKSEIRYCEDIGMFAIDRPRTSCKHATAFCIANCYNAKLEKVFNLSAKDTRNEIYWQQIDGDQVHKSLSRKHHQVKRVRFMTRGESFSSENDIDRVKDILLKNKATLFWLPTRAWRDSHLAKRIEREIMPLKNARVQASLDPSNTEQETADIISRGWSTMFFGDDSATDNRKKCAKTWQGKKGHCASCKGGCFSKKQTHVHLKQH